MLRGFSLNKYYKRYWYLFLIGIAILIVVDYVQTLIPVYLGDIVEYFEKSSLIDSFEPYKESILQICGYTILCAGIMFIGRIGFRLTIFRASKNIEAEIREEMFTQAEKMSTEYYQNQKIGSIMSWMTTDLEVIEDYLGWGTIMLIDAIFLSIFVLVKMFSLSVYLTLFTLVPFSLIAIWAFLHEKMMKLAWTGRQEAYDNLYDCAQETFSGLRVIKAFLKEEVMLSRFAKVAKESRKKNLQFSNTVITFRAIINVIIAFINVIIMGIGGWFAWSYTHGKAINIGNVEIALTTKTLIAFIGLFSNLVWPLIALGEIVSNYSSAKSSLNRVDAFMKIQNDLINDDGHKELNNVKGKIEFKNFSFAYPGSKKNQLSDVNFVINPGETIGIVGKVGSGKTTLVESLLKIYKLNKNQIYIDDIEINDISTKSIRDNISISFQQPFLFGNSISENIKFGDKLSDEEIDNSLKFSDFLKDIDSLEDGKDTNCGENALLVSGGQKQRISISREYIRNTPIMILDDSVSAVDTKTEDNILKNIKKERTNKTTILVASRISSVKNADRIVVLKDGRIEAVGSFNELLKESDTFRKMYELQKIKNAIGV